MGGASTAPFILTIADDYPFEAGDSTTHFGSVS